MVMLYTQCGAITMQSIFSQILTIDTPPIACEGDTLREAVPSHAGPLSVPLFKQWNLLLPFV